MAGIEAALGRRASAVLRVNRDRLHPEQTGKRGLSLSFVNLMVLTIARYDIGILIGSHAII